MFPKAKVDFSGNLSVLYLEMELVLLLKPRCLIQEFMSFADLILHYKVA